MSQEHARENRRNRNRPQRVFGTPSPRRTHFPRGRPPARQKIAPPAETLLPTNRTDELGLRHLGGPPRSRYAKATALVFVRSWGQARELTMRCDQDYDFTRSLPVLSRPDSAAHPMDFPLRHWIACERRRPAAFRLVTSCFLKAKDYWIRHAFESCNFSFILNGCGEYVRAGKIWSVEAPCVITQWPGEPLHYGPRDAPKGTWDELYLIYQAETRPLFEACHLIDPERPVWAIRDCRVVLESVEALARVARAQDWAMMADRADRLAELLILESWQGLQRFQECTTSHDMIQAIMAEMRACLDNSILNPDALAAKRGWSSAVFRRHWAACMPDSPARTLQVLRLQTACSLLIESSASIREVAIRTGFSDEFYFSRRFSQAYGMAPSAYRRHYAQPGKDLRASTPPFARSAPPSAD